MRNKRMAAVVMMENGPVRRNAEDVLAREITHHGAIGVAMYTIMPDTEPRSEEAAKKAVEHAGVRGVIVMRPKGKTQTTETNEYYSDPMYGSYWGGYYPYGWGSAWGVPAGARRTSYGPPVYPGAPSSYYPSKETVTTTTESVVVEVLVYSLEQNKLVWAGVSHSTEPKNVDEFVTRLAAATARELEDVRLIWSK
jgi:hypothetical protein